MTAGMQRQQGEGSRVGNRKAMHAHPSQPAVHAQPTLPHPTQPTPPHPTQPASQPALPQAPVHSGHHAGTVQLLLHARHAAIQRGGKVEHVLQRGAVTNRDFTCPL